MVSGPLGAEATPFPRLPCASDPAGAVPPFTDPPHFRIWQARELESWQPHDCFGWPPGDFSIATALSGAFEFDGSSDELLARFGALSDWKGIKYWSFADGRWQTFITDSTALKTGDAKARRPDFTLDELKARQDLYFLRADDRSSRPVIYRMRVDEAGPDRLVIRIDNVSPVMSFVVTVFDTGDIRSTYILEKIAPGRWGCYAMTELLEGMMVIGNHDDAYMTRNVAIFRYLAGIPTDQDPPPASP
jgi:hypothetical protein